MTTLGCHLVSGKAVHDDDIAGLEHGCQELLDIGQEHQADAAQPGHERRGASVSMRGGRDQALAARCRSVAV